LCTIVKVFLYLLATPSTSVHSLRLPLFFLSPRSRGGGSSCARGACDGTPPVSQLMVANSHRRRAVGPRRPLPCPAASPAPTLAPEAAAVVTKTSMPGKSERPLGLRAVGTVELKALGADVLVGGTVDAAELREAVEEPGEGEPHLAHHRHCPQLNRLRVRVPDAPCQEEPKRH
jgi:hypothetical protein